MTTPSPSDTDKEPDECIAVLPPAALRPTNSLDRTPPQAIAQPKNAKVPAAPKRKPNPITLDAADKDNSNSNSYKEQMTKPKNEESMNSGIAKALALAKALQPSGRNIEIKKQIIAILEPLVSNTEPETTNKEPREETKQTTSIEADLSEIKAAIRTLTGSGDNQRSRTGPHSSTPPTPTIHERVDSIEKTVNEINKTVKALATSKTWA